MSSPRKNRSPILVIAFYALLIGGTLLTTWLATRHPKTRAFREGLFLPMAKVLEIVDVETIHVLWQGEETVLRIRGVEKPSAHPDRLGPGLDPASEDVTSRKALYTWINRRALQLKFDEEEPPRDEQGRLHTYAELYGVDVGRKVVEEGQAFAAGEDHPRREVYLRLEAAAKSDGKGVWRSRRQ